MSKNLVAVVYDINKETGTDRADLLEHIKTFGMAIQMSESAYALVTDSTTTDVYKKLIAHVDGNDRLVVFTMCKPVDAQLPEEIHQALIKLLAADTK